MDQIIDIKNFVILSSSLTDSEVIKTIRLLTVFGNTGSEVIFATNDDKVYCLGQNKSGCLGLGTSEQHIREPRLNATLSGKGLKDIVCGFEHCIGLTSEGKCYAWGYNQYGRLGTGTNDSVPIPQLITELDNQFIVDYACGVSHTLALTSKGQIYSWGRNNWGQLGINHFKSRFFPNLVDIPHKVVQISCGRNHCLALIEAKQVFVWGLNDLGQLGIHPNCTKRPNGERSSTSKPFILPNFSRSTSVAKVVCGANYSLILTTNGWVYAFGDNACGQLGGVSWKERYNPTRVADNDTQFKDIIANNQNDLTIAVTEDHKCYVWGITDPKVMTELSTSAHPISLSLFDIYAIFVKFKITFKTLVLNEDNKQLNEIKCQTILKTCPKSDTNANRTNGPLRKAFDSNKSPPNRKPIENKRQNNQIVVNSEPKSKIVDIRIVNQLKEPIEVIESQESMPQSLPQDFETNSVLSIDSDDFYSCLNTVSKGAAGLKLLKCLTESFDKKDFSDLRFVFNDSRAIYCHKTILKVRNHPFWENCCRNLRNCSGDPLSLKQQIFINSYPYETFHVFLQYLYGFDPVLDNKVIDDVLKMAHIYREQELRDLCCQYMQKTDDVLNLVNVCTLYEKAIKHELNDLEKFCIEFTAKNWKNVCKSEAFQALSDSLSERLMSEVFGPKK